MILMTTIIVVSYCLIMLVDRSSYRLRLLPDNAGGWRRVRLLHVDAGGDGGGGGNSSPGGAGGAGPRRGAGLKTIIDASFGKILTATHRDYI